MNIIIEETGESAALEVIDPNTGADLAHKFIKDTLGTDTWVKNTDGSYTMPKSDFDCWQAILNRDHRALSLMEQHASLMTDDIYKEIWHAETSGINKISQIRLEIIERVTTGKIEAKTVASKSGGGLHIGKDTTILHCYEDDGLWHVSCEGTFILNTSSSKYELPIGVDATHKTGSNSVVLDESLDSPINLSESQSKVVYDVLFNAIKKELASAGIAEVKTYNLGENI